MTGIVFMTLLRGFRKLPIRSYFSLQCNRQSQITLTTMVMLYSNHLRSNKVKHLTRKNLQWKLNLLILLLLYQSQLRTQRAKERKTHKRKTPALCSKDKTPQSASPLKKTLSAKALMSRKVGLMVGSHILLASTTVSLSQSFINNIVTEEDVEDTDSEEGNSPLKN